MGVSFDGTDARQGGGGGMVPPGNYTARVREAGHRHAQSGSKGLECTLEVDAGPEKGGTIRDTLWLEKNGKPSGALPFSRWSIECAGAAIPAGAFEVDDDDPKFASLCRSMIGQRVAILVGTEPDRDNPEKLWPRVQQWDKAQGAPANDLGGAPAGGAKDDDIPF